MSMHDLNSFPKNDVAEYRKEGKDSWHGSLPVYRQEWYIVDLKTVREIAHPDSIIVCMCDDNNFMPFVYQTLTQLIDMRFNATGLWIEEIRDHGDGEHA